MDDAGLLIVSPKTRRFGRVEAWLKPSSGEPQLLTDDRQNAIDIAQKRASLALKQGSVEEVLIRVVQNQVVLFMEADSFNKIAQADLEKLYQSGKKVLSYIDQKASRSEFFVLYWLIFYGFKLAVQAVRYALEARSGSEAQGRTSLQCLQEQGLFGAYRAQLQKLSMACICAEAFTGAVVGRDDRNLSGC